MFVISNIIADARRPWRFHVIVADECVATVSLETIVRLGLHVGLDVSDHVDALRDATAQLAVYDRAIAMLASRARSTVELATALTRHGADRPNVEWTIALLTDRGLLDDAAFARTFARGSIMAARHSPRRVVQALLRKGIDREIAGTAVSGILDEEGIDRIALVEAAARKKIRSLMSLAPRVRRNRLYAFLARRGFDGDDIRRALEVVDGAHGSSMEC